MKVAGKTVLITGASQGIGRAVVGEALRRGARQVFAGTRGPLGFADERVVPLALDETRASQVEQAVGRLQTLDLPVNHAGAAIDDDLSRIDRPDKRMEREREARDGTAQNYALSFAVEQSPETVFAAVSNVRGWWSQDIDGKTDALGATFKFRYKELHLSTQKITEWVPGKKVVWHVTESHIGFVKDKSEWKGTDIVFEITSRDGKTELHFTHMGLAPAIECYGDCSRAWRFYIEESLRSLVQTGAGRPNLAIST